MNAKVDTRQLGKNLAGVLDGRTAIALRDAWELKDQAKITKTKPTGTTDKETLSNLASPIAESVIELVELPDLECNASEEWEPEPEPQQPEETIAHIAYKDNESFPEPMLSAKGRQRKPTAKAVASQLQAPKPQQRTSKSKPTPSTS